MSVPSEDRTRVAGIYMILMVKECSMNKAQGKKRGYGLQIAGCSMAVYKALIDGTRSRVLCRTSNNSVNNRIKWLVSKPACNASLFAVVYILGICTCYSIITELENTEWWETVVQFPQKSTWHTFFQFWPSSVVHWTQFSDQFCNHLIEVSSRLCSSNLPWNVRRNSIPAFPSVYMCDTYSLFIRGNGLQKVESWLDREISSPTQCWLILNFFSF